MAETPRYGTSQFFIDMDLTARPTGSRKIANHSSEDHGAIECENHKGDNWAEESKIASLSPSSLFFSSSLSFTSRGSLSRNEQKSAFIAACFLRDYERGQPPTLSNTFSEISCRQLIIYHITHSIYWRLLGRSLATIALFIPSFDRRFPTSILHTYSTAIFATDMYMKDQLLKMHVGKIKKIQTDRIWFDLMKCFLFIMSTHTLLELFFLNNHMIHDISRAVSVFKPVVFFYQSRRARDALEAISRISKKVLKVIVIEMVLILVFATVACRLYYKHESFESLSRSWLSLFACEFFINWFS